MAAEATMRQNLSKITIIPGWTPEAQELGGGGGARRFAAWATAQAHVLMLGQSVEQSGEPPLQAHGHEHGNGRMLRAGCGR